MEITLENASLSANNHYLLLPNINRSDRELPDTVSASDIKEGNKLDKERAMRKLSDKEMYSLMISNIDEEVKVNKDLLLEISYDQDLYKFLDKSGKAVAIPDKNKLTIDLKHEKRFGTKGRGIQFFVEAQTFTGSSVLPDKTDTQVSFRLLGTNQQVLQQFTKINNGTIMPSNLILVSDQAPAHRLLMCELEENQPSVQDVKSAVGKTGVPITFVPSTVGLGDTWLQDQFQLGYTSAGKNPMQVIIHLPRMVNDSALYHTTPNLKNFVDQYFPSKSVGVLKDFWIKIIEVKDGAKEPVKMGVAVSYILFKEFSFIRRVLNFIFGQIERIDPSQKSKHNEFDYSDLFAVRLAVNESYNQLKGYTNVKEDQRQTITALKSVVDNVSSTLNLVDAKSMRLMVVTGDNKIETFLYTEENKGLLNEIQTELYEVHSPGNFGGNIEVSPPMKGMRYGKIMTGTIHSKELKKFLVTREPFQPLASVYTDWLTVGHIDEILCFLKDTSSTEAFSICRASPRLGVTLLERLKESKVKNVLVTRLFRGKKWIHEATGGNTASHLPPNGYIDHVNAKISHYDLSGFSKKFTTPSTDNYYDSAFHDDRKFMVLNLMTKVDARYAAFMSIEDTIEQTRVTNRAIDDFFLTGDYHFADDVPYVHYYTSERYKKEAVPGIVDKILKKEFSSVPVLQIPVIFDKVANFSLSSTKAFMPDMVNLQTLNQHLLIPRPYGPRMKSIDAIQFMKGFLSTQANKKLSSFCDAQLNEVFISKNQLDITYHWTSKNEKVSIAHIGKRPTEFDANFEEMWLSIYQSIYSSNPLFDFPSVFDIKHRDDPFTNHPISVAENLFYIANYFKDGFDEFKNCEVDFCKGDTAKSHPKKDSYNKNIQVVMDKIEKANPGVFNDKGDVLPEVSTKIIIPENTVDIFELYTQLLLSSVGQQMHWVDSWYYHTHGGGIHCGTNVLRTFA